MREMFVCPLLISALCAVASAQQGQPVGGYQLLNTISIPGGLTGFDISWADSASARYYLADRGNATANPAVSPRIDVIDTLNGAYLTSINLPSGANGVVAIPRAHELWVGLTNSTVAVIDTDTGTITQTINTGGSKRADELAYDPADRLILIANDQDTPPFVTFISQQDYSVVKTLRYDGSQAPNSTGGIEQSLWDAGTGKFYIAIPATTANPNGEIDEIDPSSMAVTRSFPTVCKGPSGLVLIPNQRLMTACGDVIDVSTGKVLSTVTGAGGDEIWYNSGDQRVYFGGGTDRISVQVVSALGNATAPLTTLTVGQTVPSPGVSQTTHSVAADSSNNLVFIPVSGVGVQVWRNGATLAASPNPVPVSSTALYGSTFLSWNAPNVQSVEVHVGSPNGPLFTAGGNRGSVDTGVWVPDGMIFYLQNVSGGLPLTSANTLATLQLHLQR